jgi:hypothetical protein
MRLWHALKALARSLARRNRVEDDLDAEIRSYKDLLCPRYLQHIR